MRDRLIAHLAGVSVARAAKVILQNVDLTLRAGDRIFVSGENGAGKTSLLYLLAGRLHPYENRGEREYPWLGSNESLFHLRRHIALVSRDEQLRLQKLHAHSSVADFLLAHLGGDDFLYRELTPHDHARVADLLTTWQLTALAGRFVRTLSLGEMRLATIVRAALLPRRLYLLDEILSSLSEKVSERVRGWMQNLPAESAVIFTGHGNEAAQALAASRHFHVAAATVRELTPVAEVDSIDVQTLSSGVTQASDREVLIHCVEAGFYHDFVSIFSGLSFIVTTGDRILLTGPNGSGKTTLLRIMHGDFRPAWQQGTLLFEGLLAHEQRTELWQKVQFVAAAQFSYFPVGMTVRDVLASRLSGSIYIYESELPDSVAPVLTAFEIPPLLHRLFATLSEGEKTRVLIARAFLEPAPVYLIDEGFMALSGRFFTLTQQYLNALPAKATVVIAANERITELRRGLSSALAEWRLAHGQLTILP